MQVSTYFKFSFINWYSIVWIQWLKIVWNSITRALNMIQNKSMDILKENNFEDTSALNVVFVVKFLKNEILKYKRWSIWESPRAATSNGTLKRKLDNLLQFSFLIKKILFKILFRSNLISELLSWGGGDTLSKNIIKKRLFLSGQQVITVENILECLNLTLTYLT